ncbi:unnamed protein product [Lactuca virosa]|uniref:Uncharacterized protein n=1 Tax=Lactuca virosa TaxID=75947 RepID=A0AAU9PL02_9ASTR|nr:unnamed protein product [Lactuca virosa]
MLVSRSSSEKKYVEGSLIPGDQVSVNGTEPVDVRIGPRPPDQGDCKQRKTFGNLDEDVGDSRSLGGTKQRKFQYHPIGRTQAANTKGIPLQHSQGNFGHAKIGGQGLIGTRLLCKMVMLSLKWEEGVVKVKRCLLHCGILALDELTTNLDVPNAESLAAALLSWQPSTVAEDIVYVFLCCYCGFGNIIAYWSNCMYLT